MEAKGDLEKKNKRRRTESKRREGLSTFPAAVPSKPTTKVRFSPSYTHQSSVLVKDRWCIGLGLGTLCKGIREKLFLLLFLGIQIPKSPFSSIQMGKSDDEY